MLLSVIDADMAQAGCGNSDLTELAPGRGCAVTVGLGRGGSLCPELLAGELLAGKLSWLSPCCLPPEPDCDAGRTV